MKGLILKDLMCLRKQRVTYIYIVIVVFVISIMYVLSARFGNIALTEQAMAENGLSELDVKSLMSFALVVFMALPLAMVGDVSSIFMADGQAGFVNVSSVLPVSMEKRVLSRYITVSLFFGIGIVTDLFLSFVISRFTELVTFVDFCKTIITVSGGLFIYGALICFYMFVFGYGKESYAQISAATTIIAVLVLINFTKVKMVVISCFNESAEISYFNPVEAVSIGLKDHYLGVFISAVVTGVLSYVLSVWIAKRKRGLM